MINIKAHAFAADQETIIDLENDDFIRDQCMTSDGRIHVYINALFDTLEESEINKKLVR